MPAKESAVSEDVRKEAQALARDVAKDVLEFTRVAWKLTAQVGRLGLHAAEDLADEAEKTWQRQRGGKSKDK